MKGIFVKPSLSVIIVLTLVMAILISLITSPIWIASNKDSLIELLALSCLGIVILSAMVAMYVIRLVKRYRANIPGTALAIRFLLVFAVVTVSSLSLVYLFSLFFLNRSIDSWFDLQIGEAVKDVNVVEGLFIDSLHEKIVRDLKADIEKIAQTDDLRVISKTLFDARDAGEYEEVTYLSNISGGTSIIASSGVEIASLTPTLPADSLINKAIQAADSASQQPEFNSGIQVAETTEISPVYELYPSEDGSPSQLRVLIPVPTPNSNDKRFIQVSTTLQVNSQTLLDRIGSINRKYTQYDELLAPFKFSLVLALTLITLFSLLLATWVTMAMTQKLVAPLQALSKGTLDVTQGIYDKLPLEAASDDLNVLFESFNAMTTEIKSSQEALRQSRLTAERRKSNLEVILRHLSSGVLFIDQNARLSNINIAAEVILGVQGSDVMRRTLGDLAKSFENLSSLFLEILQATKKRSDEMTTTANIDSADGQRILVFSATRLPVANRDIEDYVVVIEDITDLVRAQRSIAWGEVASRMAHEILNPLQPIRLAVDRIRMKTQRKLSGADSQSLELAFGAIYRQLEAMQLIVNEFRNYQQITDLNLSLANLNELVLEVAELNRQDSETLNIVLNLDPQLPVFKVDANRMVQVLNNLLINARDAVVKVDHPTVTIKTKFEPKHTVILTVSDNGPGFDKKILDQMFEPYATTKEKGMGLGLGIVKRIIDLHEGKIYVSNLPKEGAEFKIVMDTQFTSINL